jgi:hypothetical protein
MDENILEIARTTEINLEKRKFTSSKKIVIFIVLLLILVFAVFLFLLISRKTNAPIEKKPEPTIKVNSSEVVQKSISSLLLKEHFIYYEKTREYVDGFKTPIITELWTDSDSQRFLKKVANQDGIKIWQGFDGNIAWQQDFQEKTFIREISQDKNNSQVNFDGQKIELINSFQNLLKQGKLNAKEENINGKAVYVISNTLEMNADWDVLVFDKSTYKLLWTEKHDGEAGKRMLTNKVEYETLEFIERTDLNIQKYFRLEIPADFKIINSPEASDSSNLNP